MLSIKWSRVVAGVVAGAAVVGSVGYHKKASAVAINQSWSEKARNEAYRPAYNVPPKNYRGPLFEPNFDFPTEEPILRDENLPWLAVDFKTDPEVYLKTVLDYCFEGNTECDFRVQENKVRRWYNAPWMASRPLGREPIHGLTMERPSDPGYIDSHDKRWVQTWAVGFYNSFGAYTIGKFWKEPGEPTLTDNVLFPVGTAAFKLLFTQATKYDAPFLEGSKEWDTAIGIPRPPIPREASDSEAFDILEKTMKPRYRGDDPHKLRLIQVDVMVRDPRAVLGWVFGSFMYHNDVPEEDAWRRLIPMSLQYGNDPDLTQEKYDQGQRPVESWTNPRVKEDNLIPKSRPYLGYLERANGVVDNFISCCASCHSTASIPTPGLSKPDMVPPDKMKWFRNINAGEPFEYGFKSLDYSLQLDAGLNGFFEWKKSHPKPT